MPLIVENGQGREDAESYCTVAFMRNFLESIGVDTESATDDELEISLRRATIGFEALYAGLWPGQRANPTQALSWPRYGLVRAAVAVQPDTVPVRIQQACALAGWRAYEDPDALTPDMDPTERIKSETIGPISITYSELAAGAREGISFGLLDALVGPHLAGGRKGQGNFTFFRRA